MIPSTSYPGAQAQEAWRDEITFTLVPGASAEIKLVMEPGMTAEYAWVATGGRINFDLHAHGAGQSIDYDRGRGVTSGEGSIKAPFAGEHGWFWRKRDKADVTVTLQLRGDCRWCKPRESHGGHSRLRARMTAHHHTAVPHSVPLTARSG